MKKQFIKASILTALTLTAAFSFPTAAHAAWDYTGGHWFYTTNDGVATGWQNIGGTWYYFSEIQNQTTFKGEMATGWKNINGKWYYFYNNGSMAKNTTINGFKIDPSGVWIPDNNASTITANNTTVNTSTVNIYSNNQTSVNTVKEKMKKEDIKNKYDLSKYLTENYSTLKTPIGILKFTFSVSENSYSGLRYDYDISTKYGHIENDKYGLGLFAPYELEDSIRISNKDKEETIELLKEHQKKIAKLSIDVFKDKKIRGSYYDGWYRYPSLRLDWQSIEFFSWNNYDKIDEDYFGYDRYYNTEVTDFHWTPEDDDYFN